MPRVKSLQSGKESVGFIESMWLRVFTLDVHL